MYLLTGALIVAAFLLSFAYYSTRDAGSDAALAESFQRAQAGQQESPNGN